MDPQKRPYSPPPPAQFPPLPSLEHLKKQAKHLLAACQGDDATALNRLRRWFPDQTTPFKLCHAQLAVAREHGCTSWTHLRRSVLNALVDRLAVRHWTEWRAAAAARTALEQAGEEGLLAVLEGLSHPEPRVRRGAVDFMDHHADDRCVPKLAELVLHDPVPYVRWSALHALECQRCKPSPLTTDLAPLLVRAAQEDPSPRVRWRALGSLPTPDLVRAAREDPSPYVRWRYVGSLPTPDLVRAAREDPSPRVRLRALAVLGGRAGSVLAQQTLEGALHDPHADVRRTAHQALSRLSPEYRQLAAQRAREAKQAHAGAADPAG